MKAGTEFTPEFKQAMESRHAETLWKPTQYFRRSGDLRDLGFDCIVHLDCKLTKEANHKIEIVGVGQKTYSQMVEDVGRVFKCEPERLKFARADLTADVNDVPVPWFHEHCYVSHKRYHREISEIEPTALQLVRNAQAKTLYWGKEPNIYRIYDKAAERAFRYGKMQRSTERAHRDWREVMEARRVPMKDSHVVPEPTLESYETMFGHSPLACITRIERQCHGKDLEKLDITTLEDFRIQGRYLRPFKALRFITTERPELDIKKWGIKDYYIGMGVKNDIERYGWDWTRQKLLANLKQNLARFTDKYQPFIRAALMQKDVNFTAEDLQIEYERSTYLQMAA